MVPVRYKGFVSNVYVLISLIQSVIFAAPLSLLLQCVSEDFSALLFLGTFFAIFVCLAAEPLRYASVAFQRVTLTAEGVRCGKSFIPYENIEKISVKAAYIDEWFGFRYIESAIGASQHNEIYTENMICINCDFLGFGRTAKQCIYIPQNRKTEELLMSFCEAYRACEEKHPEASSYVSRVEKKQFILRMVAAVTICLILLGGALLLMANGIDKAYALAFLIPFFVFRFFKSELSSFIRKKVNKNLLSK